MSLGRLNLTEAAKADRLFCVRWGPQQLPDDLMKPTSTDRRRWMSRIAGITAAILLLAQTVGVAHFHPLPSQHKYVTNAAVSVDDGLCALCLVRFHSPAALIVVPHPAAPIMVEVTALGAASMEPLSSYRSHRFGRAPPASV
jgi:hypothetical protein